MTCPPELKKYMHYKFEDGYDTINHLIKPCNIVITTKCIQTSERMFTFLAYIIKYHVSTSLFCILFTGL